MPRKPTHPPNFKPCQNQIRTDDRIKMIYAFFFAIFVKVPVDTEGRTLKEELLVYMLAFLSFSIGGGIKTMVRISGTTASRSWKTYEDHCSRTSDMGLLCLVRNKIIPKHPQTSPNIPKPMVYYCIIFPMTIAISRVHPIFTHTLPL